MIEGTDATILPGFLQDLYSGGIYLIPEPGSAPRVKPSIQKKSTLALSSEPVEAETLSLLTGIIQACKIDLSELNILEWKNNEDYTALLEKTGAGFILMFGVEPAQIDLPLVFPHFQTQQFGGATWVASPDLRILHHDKLMKSKLWLCLKQAFSI